MQSMYKGELALAYNPTVGQHFACQLLNQWIEHYPGLLDRLGATGYRKTQRILTPAQVALIFDALGEP